MNSELDLTILKVINAYLDNLYGAYQGNEVREAIRQMEKFKQIAEDDQESVNKMIEELQISIPQ